jgi:hypothetical protein
VRAVHQNERLSTSTFLKELIAEDCISAHLGVDANDAPSDFLVSYIRDVDIVDVMIYFVEVGMDLLQSTSFRQVYEKGN